MATMFDNSENTLPSPVLSRMPDILGLSAAGTRAYLAPLGVPAVALDILEREGCTAKNLLWMICDNQPPAVHQILRQYDLQLGAIQTICEELSAALPAAPADNTGGGCGGGAYAYAELRRGEVSAATPGSPTCSPPGSPTNSPIRARSVATSSDDDAVDSWEELDGGELDEQFDGGEHAGFDEQLENGGSEDEVVDSGPIEWSDESPEVMRANDAEASRVAKDTAKFELERRLEAVHNQPEVECVAEPDINLNANADTETAPAWASPNVRPVGATRKPKLSKKVEKKEEKKLRKANKKKPLELDSSAIRISSSPARADSPKPSQKAQNDAKHSEQAEQLRKQMVAKQAEVQTTSSEKPLVDLRNGFGGLEQEGEADADAAAAAKQEANDTKKWARHAAEDKKAQSVANSEAKVVAAVSPKTEEELQMDREREKVIEIKQLTEDFHIRKNDLSKLIKANRADHPKTKKAMVQLVEIVAELEALNPSFEAGGWYDKTVRPKY